MEEWGNGRKGKGGNGMMEDGKKRRRNRAYIIITLILYRLRYIISSL